MKQKIIAIAAVASNGVIGSTITNNLLWRIPEDMKHFVDETMDGVVIMGRKTYESIPKKFRKMEGRVVIVITTNTANPLTASVPTTGTLENAIFFARHYHPSKNIYIAGGGSIYKMAFDQKILDKLIITHVEGEYDGDVIFPHIDRHVWRVTSEPEDPILSENGIQFRIVHYVRRDI